MLYCPGIPLSLSLCVCVCVCVFVTHSLSFSLMFYFFSFQEVLQQRSHRSSSMGMLSCPLSRSFASHSLHHIRRISFSLFFTVTGNLLL